MPASACNAPLRLPGGIGDPARHIPGMARCVSRAQTLSRLMWESLAAGEPASIWALRLVAAPCHAPASGSAACGWGGSRSIERSGHAFCRCTSSAAAAFAAAALWVATQSSLDWF